MPQYQGVWTLPVAARLQSNQQWATDPLYRNTTLLLQADNAANGAQNNTFLDSSSNNFTITRNGNTTQGTFTPFSQSPGWWGNFFNGSNSFLQIASPASNIYDWTSTNWTLEFWIYANAFGQGANTGSNVIGNGSDASNIEYWSFGPISTGAVRWYYYNGGSPTITTTTTLSTNRWHHLAFVNNNNNLTIYIDGISSATDTKQGTPQFSGGYPINIGKSTGSSFNGYISNLRITQSAVYTANFTPNPRPLTAISGAQLLTCQSNRFVDNSSNAYTITTSGTPSVQAFSPFAPQYQYTPSVTGGSGYFDGTGDYLSAANNAAFNFGSGNFCIETWFYPTVAAQQQIGLVGLAAISTGAGAWLVWLNSSGFPAFYVTTNGTTSTRTDLADTKAPIVNSWTHIAVARTGNTLSLFVNGARVATTAYSSTVFNDTTNTLNIAASNGTSVATGYLAGSRIVKGSSPYDATQSTITIPTAPPTAITNTSLLLNFTNAGIYDGTLKNNLETVGNAQISTSVVKYGTGSMYFDGTTDALSMPNSPVLQLGSADFTCEFWAYRLAATNMTWVFLNGNSSNFAALRIDTDTSGNVFLLMSTSGSAWAINTSGSAVLPLSTWTHIAAVRFGGAMRLYLNGVALISTTISGSLTAGTSQQVGANFGATQVVNGYIDDLRLTNGIARYTANFTPPTVALPRQ